MAQSPAFSVIIPAHNEEAVIARCLRSILKDAPADHRMEVVVAANGCTDQTAAVARNAAPDATIIELEYGSKTIAINEGNRVAAHFPRLVLDADVECNFVALEALADALEKPGVMTAAPAIRMDLSKSNWLVKAYYRAWMKQPYAKEGKGGAGCYGLSREASQHIGAFPTIIADDIWIHSRFPEDQKRYIAENAIGQPVFTIVHPPRQAIEQIRVEARRRNGNAEVSRRYPSPFPANSPKPSGVGAALKAGIAPIDLLVFAAMKSAARMLAAWNRWRGRGQVWTRDDSSRQFS